MTLARLGPEQVHLATDEVAAKLDQVIPFDPAHAPGALEGILGHLVIAEVARVLELAVVPADQCSAAEQRTGVGIGDPQIRRTRNIGIRRLVTEIRALEAQAQIAGQYRGEDAGVAKCRAVSVRNPDRQEDSSGRLSPAIASVKNGRLAVTKAQRQSLTDSYIMAQCS